MAELPRDRSCAETQLLIDRLRMSARDLRVTIKAARVVLDNARGAVDAAQKIIGAFAPPAKGYPQ